MLQWDLCIKSLDYEKDCRWVLRTKNRTQVEFPWMHQRNTGKLLSLPEGWAALLRAAWIPTVSQSDWPGSRMYLIPAVADSSDVDSIKSVSCFLFRARLCNTEAWNPIVALHLYYEWNYLFRNHSTVGLIFAGSHRYCQRERGAVSSLLHRQTWEGS